MNYPTLKEIELELFSMLQKCFSQVLTKVLKELDEEISSQRDKSRFYCKDKRKTTFETMFGPITMKRRYYHLSLKDVDESSHDS